MTERISRRLFKTGWPPPALMQDDCRELSLWFATRIDARWTLTHRVYA